MSQHISGALTALCRHAATSLMEKHELSIFWLHTGIFLLHCTEEIVWFLNWLSLYISIRHQNQRFAEHWRVNQWFELHRWHYHVFCTANLHVFVTNATPARESRLFELHKYHDHLNITYHWYSASCICELPRGGGGMGREWTMPFELDANRWDKHAGLNVTVSIHERTVKLQQTTFRYKPGD